MSDESTTVYLLRHGRTAHNREGVFRGRLDVPLDEAGRAQAAAAGRALGELPIAAVYTSPLARAVQTAEALEREGAPPARIDEGFTNIDLGPWTGRRRADVAREQPELWRVWITRPEELHLEGAESLDSVADRSRAALDHLAERHRGESIAVVSHRAVLKPLLARVLGMAAPWFWRFSLDPASITLLTHDPERGCTLECLNRTDHLPDEEVGERSDA